MLKQFLEEYIQSRKAARSSVLQEVAAFSQDMPEDDDEEKDAPLDPDAPVLSKATKQFIDDCRQKMIDHSIYKFHFY